MRDFSSVVKLFTFYSYTGLCDRSVVAESCLIACFIRYCFPQNKTSQLLWLKQCLMKWWHLYCID